MSDPDTAELLRRFSLFAGLGDEARAAVAGRTVARTVAAGTELFREGEPCRGCYLVVEGRVRVYRANVDGREQVLHTQGPGQALAEVPLFDGGPYPASARAVERTRVLFLAIDAFQSLYRQHPEIADAVIRELGRRLRRAVRLIDKISLKDVPARVAATLLEYAEAQGGVGQVDSFVLPRTQDELAAELATTRESVARALAHLRREGMISQKGSTVRILRPAALQSMAFRGRGER
jgi:CRP/FNR family transcriptional regulator